MNRKHYFFFSFLLAFAWVATTGFFPSNPPTGRTGAPGELTCQSASCHGGGNFTGSVNITGLPATIQAGETYTITLNHLSNADIAGFQITALDGSDGRAGDFTGVSGVDVAAGTMMRQYARHTSPKVLSNGATSWSFDWTAPSSIQGSDVTFYYSTLASNDNGNTTGDNVLLGSTSVGFDGSISTVDIQSADWVDMYPTLVRSTLNVEMLNGIEGRIQLFDMNGRLALEQQLNGFTTIETSALNKGIYLARIDSDGQYAIQRIVVQ